MSQFKNKVTASSFLSWYLSDGDEIQDFGQRCFDMMLAFGFVNISTRVLFDECGFIPQYICEDDDGDAEYSPDEIEFIQD